MSHYIIEKIRPFFVKKCCFQPKYGQQKKTNAIYLVLYDYDVSLL